MSVMTRTNRDNGGDVIEPKTVAERASDIKSISRKVYGLVFSLAFSLPVLALGLGLAVLIFVGLMRLGRVL